MVYLAYILKDIAFVLFSILSKVYHNAPLKDEAAQQNGINDFRIQNKHNSINGVEPKPGNVITTVVGTQVNVAVMDALA